MSTVFLPGAIAADAVVGRLRQALAELGEDVWVDSRELRGGQPPRSQPEAAPLDELVLTLPAPRTRRDNWARLRTRLGAPRLDDPAEPAYPLAPRPSVDFTGRSRELLALERCFPPMERRLSAAERRLLGGNRDRRLPAGMSRGRSRKA